MPKKAPKTYNHIVPATYQKRWHTTIAKKNVYYFDKDLTLLSTNGGNVGNNMGIEKYYILTAEDLLLINGQTYSQSNPITDTAIVENYFDNAVETQWKYVLQLFEDGGKIIDNPVIKHFEQNLLNHPTQRGFGIRARDLAGLKSVEVVKRLYNYPVGKAF